MSYQALLNFRELVAATDTWQTLTGTETAEDAAARISVYGDDDVPTYPHMIIRSAASRDEMVGVGGADDWSEGGEIGLVIFFEVPEGDWSAGQLSLWGDIADLRSDLRALSNTSTYMQLKSMDFSEPRRPGKSDSNGAARVVGSITWGVD